ncbi:copper resistance protein B [Steroidobacter sp.]|uniref:copper resistance protein B n=1 Tax=Steroidobacter sp. TaxID=1978227 RepID=UPI001A614E42|nr:copper resistance protein B [Steroidobacter sp.]MBL8265695.1 copper resistance protein B [Steroidobacter sp.]
MNCVTVLLTAIGAIVAMPATAQHPPEHQQPIPQPAADEHAGHEARGETKDDRSAEELEHAGHEMPASPENGHAHHDSGAKDAPTESERAHVPPLPPQTPMPDMSAERMIELMQMEDTAPYSMVLLDRLEWRKVDDANALIWDGQAFYGNDYNKLWFKTEGERVDGEEEIRTELLWDRIFSRWWSVQAGVRHDFAEGPERTWAALGLQGLAPYFFEVEATFYVGEEGRTAARFSGEYDLLLTQRLVLQPEVEFDIYGKDDAANAIGAGLSDAEVGLRLRYEIRREFAPFVGVVWSRQFGKTADLARAAGHDTSDVQLVAGLRVWF